MQITRKKKSSIKLFQYSPIKSAEKIKPLHRFNYQPLRSDFHRVIIRRKVSTASVKFAGKKSARDALIQSIGLDEKKKAQRFCRKYTRISCARPIAAVELLLWSLRPMNRAFVNYDFYKPAVLVALPTAVMKVWLRSLTDARYLPLQRVFALIFKANKQKKEKKKKSRVKKMCFSRRATRVPVSSSLESCTRRWSVLDSRSRRSLGILGQRGAISTPSITIRALLLLAPIFKELLFFLLPFTWANQALLVFSQNASITKTRSFASYVSFTFFFYQRAVVGDKADFARRLKNVAKKIKVQILHFTFYYSFY